MPKSVGLTRSELADAVRNAGAERADHVILLYTEPTGFSDENNNDIITAQGYRNGKLGEACGVSSSRIKDIPSLCAAVFASTVYKAGNEMEPINPAIIKLDRSYVV